MTPTTSSQQQLLLLQQQEEEEERGEEMKTRSQSLLLEAKNLLLRKLCWLYDDREEIRQDRRSAFSTPRDIAVASSSSTTTTITDSFVATAHINNNDDDDDDDMVKIQKHLLSLSKSSSSLSIDMVRKLATLYNRLCETLSSDTCQQVVDNKDNIINNSNNASSLVVRSGKSSTNEDPTTINNNNNNDDDKFYIRPVSPTTITTAALQPWPLQWELFQALHLTSLLLLIELQKIMKMTIALSCSSSVVAILEKQQTMLRTTIRQCQYCLSLLLSSSSSLSSSQSNGGIFQATKTNMSAEEDESHLHHDHDNNQIIETLTNIVSTINHPFLLSCSWQKRIQHLKNKHPTLLLPPAEQEETEDESNLLPYLDKEELAMEAQTLMRMADTPIPRLLPSPSSTTPRYKKSKRIEEVSSG
jgi:hypothetical protein